MRFIDILLGLREKIVTGREATVVLRYLPLLQSTMGKPKGVKHNFICSTCVRK